MDKQTQEIRSVLLSNQTKSLLMLILAMFMVVVLNAGLPLIQGQIGYTVDPVEMTHQEYIALKENDRFVRITFTSSNKIEEYKRLFIQLNPDLTPEEIVDIKIPDTLTVMVYTNFFWVSVGWWMSSLIGVMSTYIVFISVFKYVNQDRKMKDLKYKDKVKTIDDMNKQRIDPDTFEPYMRDVFNRQRKIKQHISNVKYDITNLERKTPFKIKELYKDYFEQPKADYEERLPSKYVLPRIKWYNFKHKKYLTNKKRLLGLLDEKYIEEYVVDSKVKYFKEIRPGFVYSGVNKIGRTVDEYSSIQTDQEREAKDSVKKIIYSALISIGFATMFTIASFELGESSILWYIISVITKLAPLVISWLLALDYNNTFFEEQLYPNLDYRYSIGLTYLAYEQRRENEHA